MHQPTPSFVWPPTPLPPEPNGPPGLPVGAAGVGVGAAPSETPWRRWLRSFERVWLDPVAEPFALRAASVGWRRDEPEAYCDRCGHDVAEHEATEYGCAACRATRPPWDRFVRLGAYEPPLSLWVQEVKFTRFHALARSLGRELGRALLEAGADDGTPLVITPVPISFRRRLARGIDHAHAVAMGVGREIGAPVRPLLRRSHGPSQRAVASSARGANVRGVFRSRRGRPGAVIAGRRVVLVDDVSTSGATARACSRALLGAGVGEVWVASGSVTREAGRSGGAPERAGGGGGVVVENWA